MAFVINPDGTITTVEADYDRYGNLKPKINCEALNDQVIKYNSNNTTINANGNKSVSKKKKLRVSRSSSTKKLLFISTAEIELFFKDRIATKRGVSTKEYIEITDVLPKGLRDYFISRYKRYLGYDREIVDDPRKRKSFKKPKNKQKAAKKKKVPHEVKDVYINHSYSSGFTLGEIATFSALRKRTPDGDMVNGRSLLDASRKPKYGYARDRYGRVQERDSFNEERSNEFSNAQNHQKKYDYSSYDENDDHDGAYSNWE